MKHISADTYSPPPQPALLTFRGKNVCEKVKKNLQTPSPWLKNQTDRKTPPQQQPRNLKQTKPKLTKQRSKPPKQTPQFVCSFTALSIHSQFLSAAPFKSGWVSPQGVEHPQPALMKSQGDSSQLGAGSGYYKAHISQQDPHVCQTGSFQSKEFTEVEKENIYKKWTTKNRN